MNIVLQFDEFDAEFDITPEELGRFNGRDEDDDLDWREAALEKFGNMLDSLEDPEKAKELEEVKFTLKTKSFIEKGNFDADLKEEEEA